MPISTSSNLATLSLVPAITVDVIIAAPPAVVWRDLADISSHVTWMADAKKITFTSTQREGTGTEFDCLTRIGPISLNDRMRIVSWEPEREMGVRHEGIVTGEGVLRLQPVGRGHTRVEWHEDLRYPLRLGGALGARVSKPLLAAIWRRNLKGLKRRIESLSS